MSLLSMGSYAVLSGRPLVWLSRWRTVIVADADSSPTLKEGRYVTTGASRSTFPSSTSCMIARAVKDLDAEARMNGVCGVTTRPEASATPKP